MKKLITVAILAAVVIGCWSLYTNYTGGSKTTVVVSGTYEESVNANGIVIRKEYPITADAQGTLQSNVASGTKVTRWANVGYWYKGNVDPKVSQDLQEVNERIHEMNIAETSDSYVNQDAMLIDNQISALSEEIIRYTKEGNFTKVEETKRRINSLMGRKTAVSGGNSAMSTLKSELENQKQQLEAQLGSQRQNLTAPHGGIYCDTVDGLETQLTMENSNSLGVSDLENFLKQDKFTVNTGVTPFPVCKVVDNSEWQTAVLVSKKDAQDFQVEQKVRLRITGDEHEAVEAKVSSISAEQNGKNVIVVTSSKYVPDIYMKRSVNVDIIKKEYSGLKVPSEAVVEQNSETFVYINKLGVAEKRPVNVLYKAEDIAIIKEDNVREDALLLYDDVIINPESV
ncbi:MAG: hypothetical protein HFI90_04115 [Clostridia bacterium]|nr:hypothetical protein [Clostridia bacterium]